MQETLKKTKLTYSRNWWFSCKYVRYSRNTGDIDIFIEDTFQNRKNLRLAFAAIGIRDFSQIESMQFVAIFTDFTNSYDLRLDVMTSVKGLEN